MSRALGRYELLRPLAKGGMAEVYLARRRAAGVEKWLVVKRIRAERATDVTFLDLFVREARLSMSLAHQNIVPVFDFGRIDDQVFLAMERIEGRDLASSLERGGPLPPLLAAFVAAECCQALDYAHRRKSPEGAPLGIVHRDVTPRNVLLSWSGEVKLTDFGIAALAGDATHHLLGTPAYMAPEQARREPLDARTDVYAVGMVLRELLTGERARAGSDRDTLLAHARTGELRAWPAAELPAAAVAIVDRATAADPAQRFADARTLQAALDEVILDERAAKKGDAPTRQLAAWLEAAWGTARGDEPAASGEVDAQHLVSFLDDGELLGTGTQRSQLATAGESGVDAVATTAVADDATPVVEDARPAAEAPQVAAGVASADASTASPSAVAARRRLAPIVLALAGSAAAMAGVVAWRSRGEPAAARAPTSGGDAAPTSGDAMPTSGGDAAPTNGADARVPALVGDAREGGPPMLVDADVVRTSSDADVVRTRSDARPRDDEQRDGERRDDRPRDRRDAGIDAPSALRSVTIGATPWAYFTVDGGSTRYETPKRIQLAPGAHVIHFDNPELHVTKDVTIDVPLDRDINHVEALAR